MITLIFSFYALLFSGNEPIQPDCINKLKELNYTYEYNQEEGLIDHRRYSRYRVDTISENVKLEVKSMYNCFKLALETDTNKVLFISYYPLFKEKAKLEERKEILDTEWEQILYFSHFRINRLIHYYALKNYKVYYNTFGKEENAASRYKIELLDKTNSKIKPENATFWSDKCRTCPF